VTFHARLGTQAERVERIAALAREIAPAVGADPDLAQRAARVAKLDLRSAMVGEFPELQGVMGRRYALAAGEPPEVADAARDHYAPLGPSDAVPAAPVSVAVALADRLDTLTGFWAIDEKPTGSKDPFALRRAGLGVLRAIVAHGHRFRLMEFLISAMSPFIGIRKRASAVEQARLLDLLEAQGLDPTLAEQVYGDIIKRNSPEATDEEIEFALLDCYLLLDFLHDRLKVFLRDRGIRHDVIDACLSMPGSDDLTLLVRRAEALAAVLKTEDGANLVQGFRRANNILTQAEAKDGVEYSYGADPKFAAGPEERALFAALDAAEAAIAPAMAREDFAQAMAAMAALRAPIDAFFEAVQVNSDNPVVRRNRLNLLHRIRAACLAVADLTKLEG
jgi:glycyl-tRNA synthetase beta chain